MLALIADTALKYWVGALCGLIVAGVSYFWHRYRKLVDGERKHDQKAYYDQLKKDIIDNNKEITDRLAEKYQEVNQASQERYTTVTDKIATLVETANTKSEKDDAVLQAQIDTMREEVSAIKYGLLSMQGKDFKEECHRLLDNNHVITLDEWEEIDAAHEAYHKLGGNHRGDQLFALVSEKATNTLTNNNWRNQ